MNIPLTKNEDKPMDKKTKVDKKDFENENAEEKLIKRTPVEGVNMEEDKKKTGEDEEVSTE